MPRRTGDSEGPADPPRYGELIAILLTGAGHLVLEVAWSLAAAQIFNVVVGCAFLIYVVGRIVVVEGQASAWGLRWDNFPQALVAQGTFGVLGVLALVGYGLLQGTLEIPSTFWLTLGLYPVWGLAQQFALQNLIGRNLRDLVRHPARLAFVSALLFSLAHLPRMPLVLLTLGGGFFFTLLYRRVPNLLAVGLVHGVLGALAFYIVLGEDPGAEILELWSWRAPWARILHGGHGGC